MDCMVFPPTNAVSQSDPEVPPSGAAFHYLVRPVLPHIGSWGDSAQHGAHTEAAKC